MAGSNTRIKVTLTYEMAVALDSLAARSALPVATQAMVLLRQGLARTIETEEVQRKVREHRAGRTAKEWRNETQEEHEAFRALERAGSNAT